MSVDDDDCIDPTNYDCDRLFPPGVTDYYAISPSSAAKISAIKSSRARRWLRVSAATTSSVGALAKFWLKGMNRCQVINRDHLIRALHDRPPGTPLITVANHHSCMDEPLIWGILDWRELSDNHLMRWCLSAHNICYRNKFYATFFSYGKSIPVVRGEGIDQQPGMNFCVDRLRDGQWAHIYPEGKVNVSPYETALLPLRWGVGRLVDECWKGSQGQAPVLLPMYHLGMSELLPNVKPYVPRIGKRVIVCIGEPLPIKELLMRMDAEGRSQEERRMAVTQMVTNGLLKLRIEALIHHAKLTYLKEEEEAKRWQFWKL